MVGAAIIVASQLWARFQSLPTVVDFDLWPMSVNPHRPGLARDCKFRLFKSRKHTKHIQTLLALTVSRAFSPWNHAYFLATVEVNRPAGRRGDSPCRWTRLGKKMDLTGGGGNSWIWHSNQKKLSRGPDLQGFDRGHLHIHPFSIFLRRNSFSIDLTAWGRNLHHHLSTVTAHYGPERPLAQLIKGMDTFINGNWILDLRYCS